jgi:peptidyl-prolyl cis-trans isomerase C
MPLRERLLRLRREPLVHFLIGGLAIFLFFAWRGTEADPESRTLIIDRARVESLGTQFTQTFRRPPTAQEIDGLIRDYIKEEVYNREARRLGLDVDDQVIRQRLRQKMEYFARSSVENAQPSDAELQKMLDADPARYASGARISFDQVYLGQGDPALLRQRAEAVLARLRRGDDWQGLGEPLSVSRSMESADRNAIGREFGDGFADELTKSARQPSPEWRGPVASGYGAHLARLRAVALPRAPRLSEVRQQVENDWRAATLQAREAQAYQALLDGYEIRIEKP